jgi:hypothetical protein
MEKLFTAAFVAAMFLFTGCAENEFSPEPNAVVVGEQDSCGWLIEYLVVPEGMPQSTDNIYWTANLRKLYREEGKKLLLQARPAEAAETVYCETAAEKGYKQIVIENAVQYSNTGVYHNNQ